MCNKGELIKKEIYETFHYRGFTITIPEYIVYECTTCRYETVEPETLNW